MPGTRVEDREIRRPEQLPQVAAIRDQCIGGARAQGQVFNRLHSASVLLRHEGRDTPQQHEGKERDLLEEQGQESGA